MDCHDIRGPQTMNPNDFDDYLTFPVEPPSGLSCALCWVLISRAQTKNCKNNNSPYFLYYIYIIFIFSTTLDWEQLSRE